MPVGLRRENFPKAGHIFRKIFFYGQKIPGFFLQRKNFPEFFFFFSIFPGEFFFQPVFFSGFFTARTPQPPDTSLLEPEGIVSHMSDRSPFHNLDLP